MPRTQGRPRGEIQFTLAEYPIFTKDRFIADIVSPVVPVTRDIDSFRRIPLKTLLQRSPESIERSPGGTSPRGTVGMKTEDYRCTEKSYEQQVDKYQEDDAESQTEAETLAAAITQRVLRVEREARVASMIFNETNFAPADGRGVSLSTAWSHANGTPIDDCLAGRTAIRGKSAHNPNALIITEKTQQDLSQNSQIRESLNTIYGNDNMNVKGALLSAEVLARVLSLDYVLVPFVPTDAMTLARDVTLGDIWTNDFAMLCYIDPTGNKAMPTLSRTMVNTTKGGGLYNFWQYEENQTKSDVMVGEQFTDEKLLEPDMGYLIGGV